MPLYPPFNAGCRERPSSPNFPQLYIVGPSSGFNKGFGSVPSPGRGESSESKVTYGLSQHQKGAEWVLTNFVATPLWESCEVASDTPENGTWESSKTLENSKRDCRGQNTLHWGVLSTVEKVLKFKCPKWPCMSHLDICSTSYGQKKGQESNWQFDSRPLKVRNQPDSGACT
jgi:hypothetical protein